MKYFTVIVLLLSSLVAGELENGLEQVKVENYEAAANSFTKAATSDDFIAQQNLGVLLNNGLGVDYDPEQASYWFGKSVISPTSQAHLVVTKKRTFIEKIFPFLDSKPKVHQGFLISQQ